MAGEEQWYYLNGEEQIGPYTPIDIQQLAAAGSILPETLLWTEGLEQWVPATQLEGLFAPPEPAHPHLIVGAEARAAHPLAGEILPPELAAAAQPVDSAQPDAAPAAEIPGHPGDISPAGADYPPPGPMKASFAWFVVLPILSILSMVGGFALIVARVNARADESGTLDDQDLFTSIMEAAGLLLVTTFLFGLFLLIFTILKMIVIHRAWRALQHGRTRTTPGKAVGFLFIPIFNLYWRFVAYLGLAKDWNHIHATHPNLVGAPRISEPLVSFYCILSLLHSLTWWTVFITNAGSEDPNAILSLSTMIIWVLALILELVFLAGVCRLINFMGRLHIRQTQPQAGGLRLY